MYQYIKLFPKKDKYSLGGKLDATTLTIFEELFFASQSKGVDKLDALQKASIQLEVLKILIRLAKDVQATDTKKYLALQEILQEVGKMLGGWLKATKQNTT